MPSTTLIRDVNEEKYSESTSRLQVSSMFYILISLSEGLSVVKILCHCGLPNICIHTQMAALVILLQSCEAQITSSAMKWWSCVLVLLGSCCPHTVLHYLLMLCSSSPSVQPTRDLTARIGYYYIFTNRHWEPQNRITGDWLKYIYCISHRCSLSPSRLLWIWSYSCSVGHP